MWRQWSQSEEGGPSCVLTSVPSCRKATAAPLVCAQNEADWSRGTQRLRWACNAGTPPRPRPSSIRNGRTSSALESLPLILSVSPNIFIFHSDKIVVSYCWVFYSWHLLGSPRLVTEGDTWSGYYFPCSLMGRLGLWERTHVAKSTLFINLERISDRWVHVSHLKNKTRVFTQVNKNI